MNTQSSIFLVIFFVPALVFAQKKNSLSLSVDIPPNFNYTTTYDVETEQIITNAFNLIVQSEKNNVIVYAAIPSGITGSASTPMPVSNIRLKLNHTTCPTGQQQQVVTTDILMNTTPVAMFRQNRKKNLTARWYYDVKIPAIGYSYAPGQYNYTFRFTMTQQ